MAATQLVKLGDLAVTVRELTVGEVRDWAVRVDAGLVPVDAVGSFLLPDCSISDLQEMSDLTAEQADSLTAFELSNLRDVAKALNPHFFSYRAALAGVVQRMRGEPQSSETSSAMPQS